MSRWQITATSKFVLFIWLVMCVQMNWQLHHVSHKLQDELKLSQGSTFIANLHWHCFTAISEAIAINTYCVYAPRFTKCPFFLLLLILKQIIKRAGLFYLRSSTKILALNKDIGGFHINIGFSEFSFSTRSILWRNLQPHLVLKGKERGAMHVYR